MALYKDVSSLEVAGYIEPKNRTFSNGVQFVLEKLDAIPEADVEPVIHAYWEKECRSEIIFLSGESTMLIERKCSNCHLWSDKEILKYYPVPAERCSKCGAKMDGKENK